MQWRIESDNSIHVWTQPWLRSGNDLYVSSTHSHDNYDVKVSDLIHHDKCVWKRDMVEENFNSIDAAKILNIPLLNVFENEKVLWKFSSSGDYTVRSPYHNYGEYH